MIELLFVITAISLVGGAIATIVAWHAVQENRRRSEVRIARLSEVIHASEPREGAAVPIAHLLDDVTVQSESGVPRRRLLVAVLAATAVLVGVGVTRLTGRSASHGPAPTVESARDTSAASSAANRARGGPATLELVSLVHERGSAGELDVRGEVRNPENGATLEDVTAVAMLFDGQGAYLASGRAPLDGRTLPHGAAARFAIRIPDAAAAERYRVSFRTHDRIIPHTDRRRNR